MTSNGLWSGWRHFSSRSKSPLLNERPSEVLYQDRQLSRSGVFWERPVKVAFYLRCVHSAKGSLGSSHDVPPVGRGFLQALGSHVRNTLLLERVLDDHPRPGRRGGKRERRVRPA